MLDWFLLWVELLKTIFVCGFLMALGFLVLVFVFSIITGSISAIYEFMRGNKDD